jgi:hypothetical protein
MASTVRIKHLFTCEADFDGPSGQHGELGSTELVGKHVTFATKATLYRRGNHAHPTGRESQHCRQDAVHIVRRLRSAPQGQRAVRRVLGHGRVLLHEQVRIALKEKGILPDILCLVKTLVHITELQSHDAVHVSHLIVVVDAILRVHQGIRDGHQRAQWLVRHLDVVQGRLCCSFIHRRYRVTHVAHFVEGEGMFILVHRHDTVGLWHISPRNDSEDAR